MYKNIPQEMKDVKRWVNWKYEKRGDRLTKIPKNSTTGENASSTNSNTWANYETAFKQASKHDGIGFVLGDGWVGVDIDNKDKEVQEYKAGKKDNVINEFIETLGSYAEYSPSGNGIHVIGRGKIPKGRNRKGDYEFYDNGRYFTVTGDIASDETKVIDFTENVEILHKKYLKTENDVSVGTKKTVISNLDLSETEILDIASRSKQGTKFNDLFNGMYENYFSSQSEADISFCNMLAFWTQRDFNKIDTIFRNSGLYRDKWDSKRGGSTYGEDTINKAIADNTEVYTPSYNVSLGQKNSALGKDTKENDIKSYTPNYITDEGFHKEPNQALGVYKTKQGYMLGKMDNRGERHVIPLTNYYLEVIEMIKNKDENILRCNLNGNGIQVEKLIHEDDFINIHKFREATSVFNFFNKLKDDNLQDVKFIESNTKYRTINGVEHLGFHKLGDRQIFITDTKALNEELKVIDDVVILEDKVQIRSNLLEQEEINKQELELLAPDLFNFNSLEITSSIFGTLVMMLMKGKVFDEGIRAKHLVMYGEAGSGKSETRRNIINSFLGLNDNDTLNCNNVTQFSLNKFAGSSDSFPMMLEEYKPWKMSEKQLSIISDLIRNTYDCVSATRGTKNQELIRYPLISPIVLVGEEGQEETATKERSMIVNFSKLESRTSSRRESFLNLCKKKELISKLGRSVLNIIIKMDKEKILNDRELIKNRFVLIDDDRAKDTVINAILGINVIGEVFKNLGVDFETSTNVNLKDMIKAINNNTFTEVLDGNSTSKSIVDNTIELIDTMISQRKLYEGEHYTFINNNSEVALNVKQLFDEVTKYKRDYNINIEILSSMNSFTKQLKKQDYFEGYRSAKYKSYQDVTTVRKSYILNVSKLIEKNLDLDNLIK